MIKKWDALLAVAGLALLVFVAGRIGWGSVIRALQEARTGPATVLAIEGATRAVKLMAGWMPARIGADESGIAGAFLALGLSPASGLTLALARRSRDLLAAFIGLIWLAMNAGFGKVQTVRPTSTPAPYVKEEETSCVLC